MLGDIVGPAAAGTADATSPLSDGIVVLRRVHRFGGGIADLAAAIQRGDEDATIDGARRQRHGRPLDRRRRRRRRAVGARAGARTGRRRRAPDHRCRRGRRRPRRRSTRCGRCACCAPTAAARTASPSGPGTIERWLAAAIDGYADAGPWYVGRPLLVTANDYTLRLYNGDTGVVVAPRRRPARRRLRAGRRTVRGEPPTARIGRHRPRHDDPQEPGLAVRRRRRRSSPTPTSPILTRELLYTAVTRAQHQLTVVGTEESIRAAVARPIARASGLRRRLWP